VISRRAGLKVGSFGATVEKLLRSRARSKPDTKAVREEEFERFSWGKYVQATRNLWDNQPDNERGLKG